MPNITNREKSLLFGIKTTYFIEFRDMEGRNHHKFKIEKAREYYCTLVIVDIL